MSSAPLAALERRRLEFGAAAKQAKLPGYAALDWLRGTNEMHTVFLLRRMAAMPADGFTRETYSDIVDAGFVLARDLGTPSRTAAHFAGTPVVFRREAPPRVRGATPWPRTTATSRDLRSHTFSSESGHSLPPAELTVSAKYGHGVQCFVAVIGTSVVVEASCVRKRTDGPKKTGHHRGCPEGCGLG